MWKTPLRCLILAHWLKNLHEVVNGLEKGEKREKEKILGGNLLWGLEEKNKKNKKIFAPCISLMNAGPLHHLQATKTSYNQNKKNSQNSSQMNSNLDFLLLCLDALEGPRPWKYVTLIYFYHPLIVPRNFPFILIIVLKYYMKALFYYRKQKYIVQKIIFVISWKPCIHLPSCFRWIWIWMIVRFSRNFKKFQLTIFEKSTSITYNHYSIFSIFMHPFEKLFHG